MKYMLKVNEPLIKTNQGSAFIQAVVMAHENISDIVIINYKDLYCKFEDNYENLELEFKNSDWEYYRSIGLADMNLYHRKYLASEKFAEFLKERIDQNNYLLLYSVDEFYLPYTQFYRKKHYRHDTYIYGYSDDHFYSMAYLNDSLQTIKVNQEDISKAFFSSYLCDNTTFSTFRVNENVRVSCSIDVVLDGLKEYVYKGGVDEEKQLATGLGVYFIMDKYLEHFIASHSSQGKIDLKLFRTIWEHKKMLCVKFQGQHLVKDEVMNSLHKCEQDALVVFRMSLRYMISGDTGILNSMRDKLERLRVKEYEVILRVIDEIQIPS